AAPTPAVPPQPAPRPEPVSPCRVAAGPADPAATRYRQQAKPADDSPVTHYTPHDPDVTRYGASGPPNGRPGGFQPCVFGEYDLLERFEPGGMGVVYRARHRGTGRLVALKRIRAERLVSPGTVDRFQREARAAGGLDHPGLVPVYEIGEA